MSFSGAQAARARPMAGTGPVGSCWYRGLTRVHSMGTYRRPSSLPQLGNLQTVKLRSRLRANMRNFNGVGAFMLSVVLAFFRLAARKQQPGLPTISCHLAKHGIAGRQHPLVRCKMLRSRAPDQPRMCRPCSFAPRGICRSAEECNFCHVPGEAVLPRFAAKTD